MCVSCMAVIAVYITCIAVGRRVSGGCASLFGGGVGGGCGTGVGERQRRYEIALAPVLRLVSLVLVFISPGGPAAVRVGIGGYCMASSHLSACPSEAAAERDSTGQELVACRSCIPAPLRGHNPILLMVLALGAPALAGCYSRLTFRGETK